MEKIIPVLDKGIGAGPSGDRYEFISAVSTQPSGMATLLTICIDLAKGCWDDNMRAARLTALLKGESEEDGIRPVATGEALRRIVGKALLKVLKDVVESIALKDNQMCFSPDGSLVAFEILRRHLEDYPSHVLAATDEHTAFRLVSRDAARWELLRETKLHSGLLKNKVRL